MDVPMASNKELTKKVNMNQNEEVPDFLGGHGDLLPADVLKMVNELLEQLHRKDKDHQGGIVFNIYEKGSMHVDHVDTQNFYGDKWAKALQHEPAACPSSAEPVFDQDTPLSDQPNPCSTKTHRSLPCSVSIIMMSYVRPSRHGDLISSAMTQAWMSLT